MVCEAQSVTENRKAYVVAFCRLSTGSVTYAYPLAALAVTSRVVQELPPTAWYSATCVQSPEQEAKSSLNVHKTL